MLLSLYAPLCLIFNIPVSADVGLTPSQVVKLNQAHHGHALNLEHKTKLEGQAELKQQAEMLEQ